jgi:hypothetical protein
MYFVAPEWMGGIYATPASPGSRPGGLIAATWYCIFLSLACHVVLVDLLIGCVMVCHPPSSSSGLQW